MYLAEGNLHRNMDFPLLISLFFNCIKTALLNLFHTYSRVYKVPENLIVNWVSTMY